MLWSLWMLQRAMMQKYQSMMTTAELHGMATTPGRTRPAIGMLPHVDALMYCLHYRDVCIVYIWILYINVYHILIYS